jgi:transporter family protein
VGIANVNSNLATAIRAIVILVLAWGIVLAGGEATVQGETSIHIQK